MNVVATFSYFPFRGKLLAYKSSWPVALVLDLMSAVSALIAGSLALALVLMHFLESRQYLIFLPLYFGWTLMVMLAEVWTNRRNAGARPNKERLGIFIIARDTANVFLFFAIVYVFIWSLVDETCNSN